MEVDLFTSIKKYYDLELYSAVIPLANLLTTALHNDRSISTPELEYQTLLFHGDSHYHERNFRAASKVYDAAIIMRKTMMRYKNSHMTAFENSYPQFTEIEMRYRLAICYRELGEHNLGTGILQAIPSKSRPPKVNLLLARLLHFGRAANTSEAIVSYKDLLHECPMVLEAIQALLELHVEGNEVNSLIVNASTVPKHIEWLFTWLKAHAQMHARKHLEAAKTLQSIYEMPKLYQNELLLTSIGKCFYYHGNFSQAQHYLEIAAMINPTNMEALMPLSVLYEYKQKQGDLEKLTASLTNPNEFTSGHWFLLAEWFYATGKMEKATSFTHKAITMNPRNVEAQLLRGKICLQLKRHKDAIYFFREAQNIANYRFEVYKGLFHCYVGLKRLKEAQTMCALAVRNFRDAPRSYVMFARTLFHSTNPIAKKSARRFVAKALEIDEHYTPAVVLMAEVHQSEGETQEAIALLKKQVVSFPHHKLYTMLGDILSTEKDLNGALDNYTNALSIDPTYHRALEGINALGQQSRASTKQEQDASMTTSAATAQDEEWPIEVDEPSIDAVELSSPAVAHGDDGESDTFSDPFWQEVDAEMPN